MTTENILRRIAIIEKSNKNNSKIRELIDTVENFISQIEDFDRRDSLEKALTDACCN